MPIVAIGLSHRTSPVEMRERFAFAEAKIPEALQTLRSRGVAEEAVILSTCNRVEIYAATDNTDRSIFEALQRFLVEGNRAPPVVRGRATRAGGTAACAPPRPSTT